MSEARKVQSSEAQHNVPAVDDPHGVGSDRDLVVLRDPLSFEAEQFKILRTNLLFPADGAPLRSIMITSALPGEGKSFVAANLAVSIAQNINEHVLLVDCDIRKPCVHRRFGYSDTPGLSEYLSDGTPLASLLVKTAVEKLTILPGGTPPPNPAELLSSVKMQQFLAEAKDRYNDRYLIIDSPPPSLTAETRAVASYVDGVVLVVDFKRTPRDEVMELVEKIGRKKVLGTIVNRYDLRTPGYGKYKKYSKYYSKKGKANKP